MRFILGLGCAFALCFLIIFGIYYYADLGDSNKDFSSPLPSSLSNIFYPSHKSNGYWMPNGEAFASGKEPEVTAKSVLSYDLTTNTLVIDKNIDEKLPLASLTKIMTAVVALENMDADKKITISDHAATIGENAMGLSQGEVLTVKELLYGLFLQSGNDAAEALAEGSPYGREDFIHLMNKKAEDLGLSSTRFTNPSGLEGDGKQYSTARDLLVITRYALEKPLLAEIAQTAHHVIPATDTHKLFELYNETNLLTSYPGVKGVKTGYTYEAGLCLVTYLEYRGHKIIAVILNSQNRRQEMKDVLDYSLKTLGTEPPLHD